MVIRDLYILSVASIPFEANAPLIIDANAILTGPIASQLLQAISRRHSQVLQGHGAIEHSQFAQRDLLNIGGQFL